VPCRVGGDVDIQMALYREETSQGVLSIEVAHHQIVGSTDSSERIRVPLEIFSIATRLFPLPGTSCKAYIELTIVLCIFTSPAPSKYPLFSFAIEIAAVNSDESSISSYLYSIVTLLDIA